MKRKALSISINEYAQAPLRGCVNDSLLLYSRFLKNFDMTKDGFNIVTDRSATKSYFINSIKRNLYKAQSGDRFLFHYSGHGSQVIVRDITQSDEADGLDEILCPYDLDWNNPLRDNDLAELFLNAPKGVKIIVLLDCCHSGTGLRDDNPHSDIRSRFLNPPVENLLSNPLINLDESLDLMFPEFNREDVRTHKNTFLVNTSKQGDIILLSGCQDNQTSADAFIAGRYHGAFTYYLVQTLFENNFRISYRNLATHLNQKMDFNKYTQNPQLEGKEEFFDELFFS